MTSLIWKKLIDDWIDTGDGNTLVDTINSRS